MFRSRWYKSAVIIALLAVSAGGQERSARSRRSRSDDAGQRRQAALESAQVETATQPVGESQPATTSAPASQPGTESRPAEPPRPKTVPLSFNNAPLSEIARFLTDRLAKPVIINKEVEGIKITLINPKPLPPDEAMYVLTTALHEYGVAIEEREHTIHLIPLAQIAQAQIKTVGPDIDLKTLVPTNQIVRKIFNLRHYDASRLVEVLKPLLPSYGHITADPGTGKIIVVASVERLMVIGGIIAELDAIEVSGGELKVFTIKNVDVFEIVPMLEKLIAGFLGGEAKAVSVAGGPPSGAPRGERPGERSEKPPESGGPSGPGRSEGGPGGREKPPAPSVGAVVVKAERTSVLMIPDPRRSAIVVSAPATLLEQIGSWISRLDQPRPPSTQTEIIEVKYGDADELVTRLTNMLNSMPDDSLRNSLRIFPFASSRRIMLVGSEQNRQLVKTWIAEIDIADAGVRVTRTFILKNADAQQVSDNLKELFQEQQSGYRRYYYWDDYGRSRGESDRTKVTITANMRSNSITVVASPEKMTRIAEQIEEWDKPLEGEQAAPRVFHLKYADPEKTKELLENLFTKKEQSSGWPPWWYDEAPQATPSPVGRLFGQFRFEAYPETGKLIVISKNEENYKYIERMIKEIDQPQVAGVPRIIQLRFADAETVAEQLNALLNAPGTPASILRRGQTGTIKEQAEGEFPDNSNQQSGDQSNRQRPQQQQSIAQIQFWWQNPPSEMIKVKQPSNLVGKLRIVPNVEQNLLLVAAPSEYADAIDKFVADLDRPGSQVLIKAVIAEITHDDATSLGYRFSTDPTVFTSGDSLITENAVRGLLNYQFEDVFGKHNTITLDVNVNNLISMLRKKMELKIKSEPKVFTADNTWAEFFDGQDVPFIKNSQFTDQGSQNQSFDYRQVGIRLRVRPHITKERNIDLTVNLLVSSIVPGNTLFGGAIIDRRETTTRIVLEDGRTFLISGILRQDDRNISRRIPGLGDIPIIGEIFKHRELGKVNSELLIFLTPVVIGPADDRTPIESEPGERLLEGFGSVEQAPLPASRPAVQ